MEKGDDCEDRQCAKCWEIEENGVKLTRLVPCHHFICSNCFTLLLDNVQGSRSSSQLDTFHSPFATIQCPACGVPSGLEQRRSISRLGSVCCSEFSSTHFNDLPCTHLNQPTRNCSHCTGLVCSECEKRHKEIVRGEIFEMTRKLSAILPEVRNQVDFRLISQRQEDEISKLSYYLDEKISLIMKTVSDRLFELRDMIVEDGRAQLSAEIVKTRAKFGDLKQTKLVVNDMKNAAVFAATPLDEIAATFHSIKNQLGAVEEFKSSGEEKVDSGPPSFSVENYSVENKEFQENYEDLVLYMVDKMMQGFEKKKPIIVLPKEKLASEVVKKEEKVVKKEVSQSKIEVTKPVPVPVPQNVAENGFDWETEEVLITPAPPKEPEKIDNQQEEFSWEIGTSDFSKPNVSISEPPITPESSPSPVPSFDEKMYSSLAVFRSLTDFPSMNARFLKPTWVAPVSEIGPDRFVVVHNQNRITVFDGSTFEITNSFRVWSEADKDRTILSGDCVFHDGFFYFSDQARSRIYRLKADFSKRFIDPAKPEMFLQMSEKTWGLGIVSSTNELLFASDSSIMVVDLNNPATVRTLINRPFHFFYLQEIVGNDTWVVFTKKKFVVKKAIQIKFGHVEAIFDDSDTLLTHKNFGNVRGTALDPAGNLIVVDRELKRIEIFNPNGQSIAMFNPNNLNPPFDPCGVVCLSNGAIIVSEFANNRLVVLKSSEAC